MTDGHPLSAFAGELLSRLHRRLGGAAFGRVGQELLVACLRSLHPSLHDNRGAGTPDCHAGERAWEIKCTEDGQVHLRDRDLQGLRAFSESRLVVLDVAFPARLWVLEARGLGQGPLRAAAHSERQRDEEASQLGRALEALLRRCDVDLLATEAEAKRVVERAAAAL